MFLNIPIYLFSASLQVHIDNRNNVTSVVLNSGIYFYTFWGLNLRRLEHKNNEVRHTLSTSLAKYVLFVFL